MRVKNNYTSHIGFGKMAMMPGAIEELPEGFDKNHPVVSFFLKKGWIEEVGEAEEPPKDPPKPVDEDGENAELLAKASGVEIKAVARLKLAELQDKCADLEIEFDAADTRAILFDKITCKLKSC